MNQFDTNTQRDNRMFLFHTDRVHHRFRNKVACVLENNKVASALIRHTAEPTKQPIGSAASKKYAHDLNLVRLKCGVECGLRR